MQRGIDEEGRCIWCHERPPHRDGCPVLSGGAAPRAEGTEEWWPKPGHYGTCAVNRGKECTCYPPVAAPRAEGPHSLLVKYGLEGMGGDPIEVLHRHLTNNHEATIGAYKATIEKLRDVAAPRGETRAEGLICEGYCGDIAWTVERYGYPTHKHACPRRNRCQSHPDGCPRPFDERVPESEERGTACNRFRHDEHCAHLHES